MLIDSAPGVITALRNLLHHHLTSLMVKKNTRSKKSSIHVSIARNFSTWSNGKAMAMEKTSGNLPPTSITHQRLSKISTESIQRHGAASTPPSPHRSKRTPRPHSNRLNILGTRTTPSQPYNPPGPPTLNVTRSHHCRCYNVTPHSASSSLAANHPRVAPTKLLDLTSTATRQQPLHPDRSPQLLRASKSHPRLVHTPESHPAAAFHSKASQPLQASSTVTTPAKLKLCSSIKANLRSQSTSETE